jgi:hypothetical protein
MDTALLVSAGIALVGAILAALYLPKTNASTNTRPAPVKRRAEFVGTR